MSVLSVKEPAVAPVLQIVRVDAPLTPPLSPKQMAMEQTDIPSDIAASISQPLESLPQPAPEAPCAADAMQVDPVPKVEVDALAPAPQRSLENEKVHLQRSGVKLADFEVRGTLGEWLPQHAPLIRLTSAIRHRDLWEGLSRPSSWFNGTFRSPDTLCNEGPPENQYRPATPGRACQR